MSGKRFFVNKIHSNKAVITGEDYSHVVNVLRHKAGDIITVFNYEHGEFTAEIMNIDTNDKLVEVTIKDKLRDREKNLSKINAFIAVVKKDKMEFIIEKLTELGVDRIIPVITKRCVVKIKDEDKKHARWEKIIYSAVKQCGRLSTPEMVETITGVDKIEAGGKKFVIWEKEEDNFLIDEVVKLDKTGDISFIIGPEGGFDDSEIEILKGNGFESVSIGDTILRSETAAVSVAGVLSQVIRRSKWK